MSTEEQVAQREEFRDYLDKAGIVEELTRVLVDLYEEPRRPDNPFEFIREHLGIPDGVDVDAMRIENEELKAKTEELEATIDALMNQLEDLRKKVDET